MGSWIVPLMHLWCLFLCLKSSTACNQNDFASLQGFFKGLSSPIHNWSLSSTDCCSWAGAITCDGSARVVGLHLFNMSLKGVISDTLSGLDQLKFLNLSSNSLTGPVPQQLFRLQNLRDLDLSVNQLSGPIPPDINLPSVETFNISSNSFNGTYPLLPSSRNLTIFDISCNSFSGSIDTNICINSPNVQVLIFSTNLLSGKFPAGFSNCSLLNELDISMNMVSGSLPDDLFKLSKMSSLFLQENKLSGMLSSSISNLSKLAHVDISLNSFSSEIPNVFDMLKELESFSAQSNNFSGHLPSSLSNLSTVSTLSLRNNSLNGKIDLNFSAMSSLSSLDLGSNLFTGTIPSELSKCLNLKILNLANNTLTGEIPSSFSTFTSLTSLSLSKNYLRNISSALGILQSCPNLTNLVLTKNFHSNEVMPFQEIQGFRNMELLVIPNCGLHGQIPQWLSNCSKLKVLDLSWNLLGGSVPPWIGTLDHLFYLDISNNSLTGTIPISITGMKSLIASDNSSQAGPTQDFPFFIMRNNTRGLPYKQVSSFPPSLILSNNMLTGPILPGFGKLKMLHVLDLSWNRLSGTIPNEMSSMEGIETLDLSNNNLTGNIPSSLKNLTFLSSFSVAYNNLVGPIPSGGQFSTFAYADFEGNPGLCNSTSSSCAPEVATSIKHRRKNKAVITGMAFGIGLGTTVLLAAVYFIVSRTHSSIVEDVTKENVTASGELQSVGTSLVMFQNKENKEISITEILKATENFNEDNIIGCGGFGLVYKATLFDGRVVAIKRLSGDYGQMEREFQAEIEALSRAQHQNLVLLQGYCKIGKDRLLIYSYMENLSLDYWLHEKSEEGSTLDWDTRLRIAQGSAKGLAYLHQACQPHILHRDIKSSNILLDANFEAHLADFGLARLVLPYDTHVTTDLVGTLGYIPPEYGQSSIATFKGDVYSFGVVLLELLTGKRPVDMSKPKKSRDLVSWAFQMKKEKRESEVFDPFIYDKDFDEQMRKVLDIACLCLNDSPKLRPLTCQLVAWLDSISVG